MEEASRLFDLTYGKRWLARLKNPADLAKKRLDELFR